LAAIRWVDGVLAFDEDNPIRLIEALRPEVHLKGGDYRADDMPETAVIRAYGGEVRILPLLEGRSTTLLAGKLRSPTGNL
jgi:glycerol-3-phosphate cytidylyltransferase